MSNTQTRNHTPDAEHAATVAQEQDRSILKLGLDAL
jgi:hypothetical protein